MSAIRLSLIVLVAARLGVAQGASPAERLTFHQASKPLPSNATTEDWPRFLGPHQAAVSGETKLLRNLPESGPDLVWELGRGTGYTAVSIAGDRLFTFHRLEDAETLDCIDPESGKPYWSVSYPIEYRDRYGYNNGPRASPAVDGDKVYTYGVSSVLTCYETATGQLVWQRDLRADYHVPQYYFGSGPSPLVLGELVIQNVGGDATVVAFDKSTGATAWEAKSDWGASYASPIATTLHGKSVVLVFAGGESNPPTGGLLVVDSKSGTIHDRFPWRSNKRESVNASTPLVVPGNRVFLSDAYSEGGVLLEFDEELQSSVIWKNEDARFHWTTPVADGGYLYGFTGRNEPDAELSCFRLSDGQRLWAETLSWQIELFGGRPYTLDFWRGWLLAADGAYLALGEMGTLAWLELSPEGPKLLTRTQPFLARESWTPPVIHRGLLYLAQNTPDLQSKTGPRLRCYDLRAEE
ncbi:PQQ-binding-like beta-propeller repeat protein [soil metagenome]